MGDHSLGSHNDETYSLCQYRNMYERQCNDDAMHLELPQVCESTWIIGFRPVCFDNELTFKDGERHSAAQRTEVPVADLIRLAIEYSNI